MTTYTLTDTEETIGEQAIAAMKEAEAIHDAQGREYCNTARALLRSCRHLMTGREINECENATGDFDDPDGFDAAVIKRLANQFPREIATWENATTQTPT